MNENCNSRRCSTEEPTSNESGVTKVLVHSTQKINSTRKGAACILGVPTHTPRGVDYPGKTHSPVLIEGFERSCIQCVCGEIS